MSRVGLNPRGAFGGDWVHGTEGVIQNEWFSWKHATNSKFAYSTRSPRYLQHPQKNLPRSAKSSPSNCFEKILVRNQSYSQAVYSIFIVICFVFFLLRYFPSVFISWSWTEGGQIKKDNQHLCMVFKFFVRGDNHIYVFGTAHTSHERAAAVHICTEGILSAHYYLELMRSTTNLSKPTKLHKSLATLKMLWDNFRPTQLTGTPLCLFYESS